MDVRAEMLVFQDFDRSDRSFGPGYLREWPQDVRGTPVQKTSSLGWFSVLAKLFRACFFKACRIIAQNGVSHRCACVKLRTTGGVSHLLGSANLPEKVSQ